MSLSSDTGMRSARRFSTVTIDAAVAER